MEHTNSCILHFIHACKVNLASIKILQVLPNNTNIIMKSLDYGLDDYLIKGYFSNNDLLCRVSRLLNFHIHTSIYINNFKNIYLSQERKELYYRNCRIKLSLKETLFLNYLIENRGFAKKEKVISYIKIQTEEKYNQKSLVMMVSRLKKKVRYITGFNLIKSKYSEGYYMY